ncbi:MAG: hypothetical protein O3A72_13155, partial [Proteobacteria bacterium]|nr:hypothetical protein [Pseudomonadota bacterium]
MRQWRWGAAGLAALLHLGAFVLLGVGRPEATFVPPQPLIIVDLVRPEPVAPPPPPPEPAPSQGGGAPAAPSVVRPVRPRP